MQDVTSVVAGAHRYELELEWGKLPIGWTLGQTAVATDSKDRVYLFNRSDHPMVVLGQDGAYIASWGEGVLEFAHGIFVDIDDCLYLPLRDAAVVLKYRADGTQLLTLGSWGEPSDTGWAGDFRELALRAAGPFNKPTDVAVSRSGDIYVSDGYGNARVHRFTADGRLLQSWGEPGKVAPGAFHVPHGVWVHADGRVLVADRENNRVQVFSSDGEFLAQWPGLRRPCDVFVDQDGIVYVAELDGLVAILTLDGELVARWSSPTGDSELSGGHSIWIDSRGDLYVGQNQAAQRLLKYRRA